MLRYGFKTFPSFSKQAKRFDFVQKASVHRVMLDSLVVNNVTTELDGLILQPNLKKNYDILTSNIKNEGYSDITNLMIERGEHRKGFFVHNYDYNIEKNEIIRYDTTFFHYLQTPKMKAVLVFGDNDTGAPGYIQTNYFYSLTSFTL